MTPPEPVADVPDWATLFASESAAGAFESDRSGISGLWTALHTAAGWHSLTGRRFQAELEHEQDRHPLIQAGMSATPAFVDVAAQIVEAAISAAAEHASWSHLQPGGGIVPSFVWIDTK